MSDSSEEKEGAAALGAEGLWVVVCRLDGSLVADLKLAAANGVAMAPVVRGPRKALREAVALVIEVLGEKKTRRAETRSTSD